MIIPAKRKGIIRALMWGGGFLVLLWALYTGLGILLLGEGRNINQQVDQIEARLHALSDAEYEAIVVEAQLLMSDQNAARIYMKRGNRPMPFSQLSPLNVEVNEDFIHMTLAYFMDTGARIRIEEVDGEWVVKGYFGEISRWEILWPR